jgi:hypothetical protein
MHRAQMTDTELEQYYMYGKLKSPTNTTPIHPKHMTDNELAEALQWVSPFGELAELTPFEEQVIKENDLRAKIFNSQFTKKETN